MENEKIRICLIPSFYKSITYVAGDYDKALQEATQSASCAGGRLMRPHERNTVHRR